MPPWETIYNALMHPHPFSITDYSSWPINMALIAVFLVLLLLMLRRLPMMYVIYAAIMILFPLCTGNINSIQIALPHCLSVQILLPVGA